MYRVFSYLKNFLSIFILFLKSSLIIHAYCVLLDSFSSLQVLEELEKEIQDGDNSNDAVHNYIDKVNYVLLIIIVLLRHTLQVQSLILTAIDKGTLLVMKHPQDHIDTETFNLLIEEHIPTHMTYCLWGNIVKNPRL